MESSFSDVPSELVALRADSAVEVRADVPVAMTMVAVTTLSATKMCEVDWVECTLPIRTGGLTLWAMS